MIFNLFKINLNINFSILYCRVLTPSFSVIQSTIQTLLIIEAWRRHCNSNIHVKQKSARQILTFLIISNISLWIINRVKNNRAEFHPLQVTISIYIIIFSIYYNYFINRIDRWSSMVFGHGQ